MAKLNGTNNGIKKSFTIIPNALINDDDLPMPSRFLFILLACQADGWEFRNDWLLRKMGWKDDATLNKYWRPLQEAGWGLKVRRRNDRGRITGNDYELNERPATTPGFIQGGKLPGREKTGADKTGGLNNTNPSNKEDDSLNKTKGGKATTLSPRQKANKMLAYWNDNCRPGKARPLTADSYLDPITARIKEGATAQDCVDVIKDRALEWLADNPEMAKNFRITTLFRKKHFTVYLDNWHDRTELEKARVKDLKAFISNPPTKVQEKPWDAPSKANTLGKSPLTNRRRKPASAAISKAAANFKA